MHSEAIKPGSSDLAAYGDLVSRFRQIVRRAVPPGAIVVVVSRGDHELLDLPGRSAWHFPRRSDGAYAGYYPADSSGAIAHLESLRESGAAFLAFPATALWWMDHYDAFRRHLEQRYRPVVRDNETCVLYALSDGSGKEPNGAQRGTHAGTLDQPSAAEARTRIEALVEESLRDDVDLVFDASRYSREAGIEFRSPATALLHYLEEGHRAGLGPHPLFDAGWYSRRHPDVRLDDTAPFEHFLRVGCTERRAASQVHSSILRDLQRASGRALVRGNWRRGSVLVFGLGRGRAGIPDLFGVANRIQRDTHASAFVVAFESPREREAGEGLLVLDDYKLACEIFRPAALRLLTKMLIAATRPQWAISEVADVLEALRIEGVGTYALLPEAEEVRSNGMSTQYEEATRMIVPSSEAF